MGTGYSVTPSIFVITIIKKLNIALISLVLRSFYVKWKCLDQYLVNNYTGCNAIWSKKFKYAYKTPLQTKLLCIIFQKKNGFGIDDELWVANV